MNRIEELQKQSAREDLLYGLIVFLVIFWVFAAISSLNYVNFGWNTDKTIVLCVFESFPFGGILFFAIRLYSSRNK